MRSRIELFSFPTFLVFPKRDNMTQVYVDNVEPPSDKWRVHWCECWKAPGECAFACCFCPLGCQWVAASGMFNRLSTTVGTYSLHKVRTHYVILTARTSYDKSNRYFNCCCMTIPALRNVIREGYKIKGSCWGDVLISCCCSCCTAVQLSAEVKTRKGENAAPPHQEMP